MRRLLFIALLATLASCEKHVLSPIDEAKQVLKTALTALNSNDIEGYLTHTDIADMDSVMRRVLSLHVATQHAEHPAIAHIDMLEAEMAADSTCTIFYQYTYADSTREVMSQKMMRMGGTWRLKLRK